LTVLDAAVEEEACPHDLTPTSSTTAAMVLGDALALALLKRRGFGPDDFARFHPGGMLGRKLLVRVRDVMVTEALPILPETATMRDCIVPLAEKRGIVAIVDPRGALQGVITVGNLTRLMERNESFFGLPVTEVMTRTPKTARADELGAAAVGILERHGIMALPVLDEEAKVIGMVHLHDLMRAGAV
jgi:arabinose-5-phosphate isomerase